LKLSPLLWLCLLCTLSLAASAKEAELFVDAKDFEQHRSRIEAVLDDPTQLSELTRPQRDEVRNALVRMGTALATAPTVDALSPEARMRVFNEQELINSTLLGAEKQSRVICRAERTVGSNLKKRRCRTVGEIERAREASKQGMERLNEQRIPPPNG
jgi:hypothetical protein